MPEIISGTKTELVRRLIGLFEKMAVDEALELFTEDSLYRFANYPPAIGREAIRQNVKASHLDQIKGITFDIKNIWETGDAAICELEINYIRIDDTVLRLPCTDVFQFEGDTFREMRVYMDASPLFAHSAPAASSSKLDLAKRLIAAVEANNLDEYINFFTKDGVYKIGNFDPASGHQGIREFAAPVMQAFKSVTHDNVKMWEVGDTVVCELEVTYVRNDDKVTKLPCMNIIRFQGDKVREYQAFIDVSPAFA